MLSFAVLLAIVIGWLRGGELARLAGLRISHLWLIVASLLIRLLLPRLTVLNLAWLNINLLVLSYLLLLAALGINMVRRWPPRGAVAWGLVAATIGVAANFIVIFANAGMPVSAHAARIAGYHGNFSELATMRDGVHRLLNSQTRLSFLADIIPQPLPAVLGGVSSIGDVLLALGTIVVIQSGMHYRGRHIKKS